MKKLLMLVLSALFLLPAAWAVDTPVQERYTLSPWVVEAIEKADSLGLLSQYDGNLRYSINREQFAQNASALVALAYDRKPNSVYPVAKLRAEKEAGGYCNDVWLRLANDLGILLGRENGDLDGKSYITRQEAAVMLARAYRLYAGEGPELTDPLPYTDADQIAPWAEKDVQIMTQLGILNGVENGKFAPLDRYSIEQCYATLVRLYEKTVTDTPQGPDPFAITVREEAEAAAAAIGDGGITLLSYWGTEDASILVCSRGGLPPNAGVPYSITYLDQDLQKKGFVPVIMIADGAYYAQEAEPENVRLSPDGKQILYNATVPEDVYYQYMGTDNEMKDGELLFPKGVYTVTIDLATEEQTYTREDLPGN